MTNDSKGTELEIFSWFEAWNHGIGTVGDSSSLVASAWAGNPIGLMVLLIFSRWNWGLGVFAHVYGLSAPDWQHCIVLCQYKSPDGDRGKPDQAPLILPGIL
jgi:hypothetical protein